MAASPYQPSSVYFAQSIHGEELGKSALMWTKWSAKKAAAISSSATSTVPATRAAPVRSAGGNEGTAVACSASVELESSSIGICFERARLQERIKTQRESFQT